MRKSVLFAYATTLCFYHVHTFYTDNPDFSRIYRLAVQELERLFQPPYQEPKVRQSLVKKIEHTADAIVEKLKRWDYRLSKQEAEDKAMEFARSAAVDLLMKEAAIRIDAELSKLYTNYSQKQHIKSMIMDELEAHVFQKVSSGQRLNNDLKYLPSLIRQRVEQLYNILN